jgi:DNA-binding SARP family transcriptional activator
VAAFERCLHTAVAHAHAPGAPYPSCADELAQAVELYRGDFLAQLSLPGCQAFGEWALVTRERLHRQVADALARLALYYEAQPSDDRAQAYAWRLLALEPWDEGAHRCLMRLCARAGKRGAGAGAHP